MKQLKLTSLVFILLVVVACGGVEEPTVATQPTAAPIGTLPPPPTPLPPAVVSEGSGEEAPAAGAAVEAAPQAVKVRPWPASDFGYGIQVHGNATVGDPAETMRNINDKLSLDWVKMQVQWWLVKPDPEADQWFFYDGVIAEAEANNLHLLVSVVGAPEWTREIGGVHGPPDDYNLYASFLTEMIARHPGRIDAIEVWNEQNLDREWVTDGGISPEEYVQFLSVAYSAIKAADPNIIVVSGALSPTGPGDWVTFANDFEYMDRALAAGMLNYADCVGAHHNGYNVPPDVLVQDTNTLPKAQTAVFRGPFDNQFSGNTPNTLWTFKSTIDGYIERIRGYDATKPLCVTEFGWASSEGYDVFPIGFEYAQDNSLAEQAAYITQAFQLMHASNDIWLAFLFNFDFGNKGGGPTDDPTPYSIIDGNGVPRPAFGAIADMEKPR